MNMDSSKQSQKPQQIVVCNSLIPHHNGGGLVKQCMLMDPSGLAAEWRNAWKEENAECQSLRALLGKVQKVLPENNPISDKLLNEIQVATNEDFSDKYQFQVKSAARYEFLRKLTPVEFADLYKRNIAGEGQFDDLVDLAIKKQSNN